LKANFQDENKSLKTNGITVGFNGKSDQKIYSSIKNIVFFKIIVSNNEKVESTTNLKLLLGLDLKGGTLKVNEGYLLDYKSSKQVANYSNSNFVEGRMKKEISSGESFFFPLGSHKNGELFFPIQIYGLQSDNEFIIEFHPNGQTMNFNTEDEIKTLSNTEHWEIVPTKSTLESYEVDFHWNSATLQTFNMNAVAIAELQASEWRILTSSIASGDTYKGLIKVNQPILTNYFTLVNNKNLSTGEYKQYYPLTNKLSKKVWYFNETDLNFLFDEPYNVNKNTILDATLYNQMDVVIAEKADLDIKINKGLNKISLSCFSEYLTQNGEMYYLLIKNSKGEEKYLQFISPVQNITCQP
jgi:hypothetical protein